MKRLKALIMRVSMPGILHSKVIRTGLTQMVRALTLKGVLNLKIVIKEKNTIAFDTGYDVLEMTVGPGGTLKADYVVGSGVYSRRHVIEGSFITLDLISITHQYTAYYTGRTETITGRRK